MELASTKLFLFPKHHISFSLRNLSNTRNQLDMRGIELLALRHAMLIQLLAQPVNRAQRLVRFQPIPYVQFHVIVPERSSLGVERLLWRKGDLAYAFEREFLLAPLLRAVLDRLLLEMLAELHAKVILGGILAEEVLQQK